MTGSLAVVVLAAGKGTRMKTELPKVLHPLAGRPLICHVLAAAAELQPECAVEKIFGAHATDKKLWVSSTKSMMGHLLGAAGAVEAAVCARTIETGIVPPTINLDDQDPECVLDYVPHTARERPIKNVVSNSFGFGGTNATLVLAAFDG